MTIVRFEKIVLSGNTEAKKLVTVENAEINLDTYEVPAHKILIKSVAYAFNPTDWKHAVYKFGPKGALTGSDVSGTVVKVGPETRGNFKVGDDVSGFLHGSYYPSGDVGAFAGYTLVDDYATINYGKGGLKTAADHNDVIPTGVVQSFEGAASINLGLFTVGLALNHEFGFAQAKPESYKGKKIIIWGGATSTGYLAIQIAKEIYGLTVIAVASSKHHAALKARGADYTYDYKTADVTTAIRKEHPDIVYGFDTVANASTFQSTYDTLGDNSHINNLLSLTPDVLKTDPKKNVEFHATLLYTIVGEPFQFGPYLIQSPPEIRRDHLDFIENKISIEYLQNTLYHNELLLLKDSFLNSVEEGFDLLRNDKVSGQKIVIRESDVVKHKI